MALQTCMSFHRFLQRSTRYGVLLVVFSSLYLQCPKHGSVGHVLLPIWHAYLSKQLQHSHNTGTCSISPLSELRVEVAIDSGHHRQNPNTTSNELGCVAPAQPTLASGTTCMKPLHVPRKIGSSMAICSLGVPPSSMYPASKREALLVHTLS